MIKTYRGTGLALLAAAAVLTGAASGRAAEAGGTGLGEALDGVRQQTIERLIQHHLEMYEKHLESRDWMARAMAVIGLARIDDPRMTERLFKVLDEDELPVVRVYAWEGLHARYGSLDEAQRTRWIAAGRKLIAEGHLRGDLRVGLVRAIIPQGCTEVNRALFRELFAKTNSMDSSDIRTLNAMRDALYHWHDRDLCRDLVGAMKNLDSLFRAEYVLGYVKWRPSKTAEDFAPEGSRVLLREVQPMWQKAFEAADADDWEPRPVDPYEGDSPVLPKAEKIEDPSDRKWRQDLELTRFRLDHLDVSLLVDSTGSMTPVVRWVQRDVAKLMRAFYLISQEPRLAIIFYRDHGDDYVVKPFPFTSNADALARAVRTIDAEGGGDKPEAVYEAIALALTKQKWSSGHYARRIVVIVGDAPPHPEMRSKIEKLVTAAAKQKFRFFCLKVRSKYTAGLLDDFDKIAEWGNGASIWAEFAADPFPDIEYPSLVKGAKRPDSARTWRATQTLAGTALPTPKDSPCRQLLREIVRTAIPEGYRVKTEPFVDTLLEYLEQHIPEKRWPFGPAEPIQTHHHKHRHRPDVPFDPQKR